MSSKPNGILTKTDREFLSAEDEYYTGDHKRQSRYQRRRDIRQRIVQSILDFSFIASHLEDAERRKIFEDPGKHGSGDEFDFDSGAGTLVAWLYRGYREQGRDFFEEIEYYVEEAERDYRLTATGEDGRATFEADIDWTSAESDAEELTRKLESGEPVLFQSILAIPTFRNFDVNVDEIESVSVFHTNPDADTSGLNNIIETIFEERLDLRVPIEVHGVERHSFRPSDFKDDDATEDDVPSVNSRKTRWNEDPEDILTKSVDESIEADREEGESDGNDAA